MSLSKIENTLPGLFEVADALCKLNIDAIQATRHSVNIRALAGIIQQGVEDLRKEKSQSDITE